MVQRSIDQKLRSRIFDTRNEKIEEGAVVTSRRGLSGTGKRNLLSVESKRSVIEKRPMQFFGTGVTIVQNRHQKPVHTLSHQHQEVEVRREKGTSEAEASLGSPTDSRAKTF